MKIRDAKIISKYAERVVKRDTKRLKTEDWLIIGSELNVKNELKPAICRRIVNTNIELANKRILDILERNGINTDKPFEIYEEALKIAKSKENSSDLIKIADRYTELLDLKPQKVTISESRQQIDYSNMLPEKHKQTISTTKTIQKDSNDSE